MAPAHISGLNRRHAHGSTTARPLCPSRREAKTIARPTRSASRFALAVIALAAVLAGSVSLWLLTRAATRDGVPTARAFIPGIGGPFELTSQTGASFTDTMLLGKPSLIFFGYTHCPDVCPTTLFQISEVLRTLGSEPGVNGVFMTVDPERDTPKALADYLSSFDPHIVGLTGPRPAIDAALKEYRVYSKKVPGADGDYTMDHSALVYLMDAKGQFVGAFNLDRPPAEAAAQLRKMM
jgi:protein SCO1/2